MLRKVMILLVLLPALKIFSSPLLLVDALFNKQVIKQKLLVSGVSTENMEKMLTSIDSSILGLDASNSRELLSRFKTLSVSTNDSIKLEKLIRIFSNDVSKVSTDEFIESMNNLYYLASRYSLNSNILSCSVCVTDELARIGIRNSVSKIEDSYLQSVLKRIPIDSVDLLKFIKRKSSSLKVQDISRFLTKEDERTYALFLELTSRGPNTYSELGAAVLKFNKNSKSQISLSGPESVGQFWKVLNTNLSQEKIKKLTAHIEGASMVSSDKRVDEFFNLLKKNASGEEEKLSAIEELKTKSCFFN